MPHPRVRLPCKAFIRLALVIAVLLPGTVFAAVPFTAGPYQGHFWTDPQTIALGTAKAYIQVRNASGQPVEDAQVKVFARMPSMDMGEREEVARPDPAQPGLYVAPARFAMEGAYTATIAIRGSGGEAKTDLSLKTGQDTGGAPGANGAGYPVGTILLWMFALLFLLYTLHRLRKTNQRIHWRSLLTRPFLGSLILLLFMGFLAMYAVHNFRRKGAMTPIEAQAMEMSTPAPPGTTPVKLAPVESGAVDSTVTYTGTAVGYIEQEVNPRVTGSIQWMPFYAGDRVKKGQLLAKLDTNELQSRVEQQRANRAMTEQMAAVSQLEYRQSLAAAAQGRSEVRSKEGALEEIRRMKEKARGMIRESRADLVAAKNEKNEAEAMLRSTQAMQPDAEAMLAAMQADQEYWSKEIARMKVLYERGAVSGEEYQRETSMAKGVDAKVRQAQAKIQSVQSDIQAAQSRLARTSAMIDSAQAKVEQAASEVAAYDGRIRMAQGDLDAARDNARAMAAAASAGARKIAQAQAGVREAGAALTTASVVKGYAEIRSLIDGVVTQRVISPGVLVQPGQTILKVSQIDPIRLQANVAEADLGKVRTGSRVVVKDKETGKTVVTRVTSITPSLDPAARTGIVEAVVPNSNGIFLPGEFVSMTITTGRAGAVTNALRVPTDAIQWATTPSSGGILSTSQQASVWIAESTPGVDGVYTVRSVPVMVGNSNGDYTEIISGLKEGQKVVTTGYQFLKEGDSVAPAGASVDLPAASPGGHEHGSSGASAPSANDPAPRSSGASPAPAPASGGTVVYKAQCGMTYSEAEAKRNNYICPMDRKPLTKVVMEEGGEG